MRRQELIMGVPVTVEIIDKAAAHMVAKIFDYFRKIDQKFSTYKKDSEISKVNRGLPQGEWSGEMAEVMELCAQTKRETGGYFNIKNPRGQLDPSGLVKGWTVNNAAEMLRKMGLENFYIDGGGDIQTSGKNNDGTDWQVGIRNPFAEDEIVKIVRASGQGVATSGTYIRGQHIYNPFQPSQPETEVASLTVIGSNIYDADRFATAAHAMGSSGVNFIDQLSDFEAYQISHDKTATMTNGFENYAAV
jgi:thiamine biosynthesis lipoprotein